MFGTLFSSSPLIDRTLLIHPRPTVQSPFVRRLPPSLLPISKLTLTSTAIRPNGEPLVYQFTYIAAGDHPRDQRIQGPASSFVLLFLRFFLLKLTLPYLVYSYVAAYPNAESLRVNSECSIEIREEDRTGQLRALVTIEKNSVGCVVRIPEYAPFLLLSS
jgi:hypothetical protein